MNCKNEPVHVRVKPHSPRAKSKGTHRPALAAIANAKARTVDAKRGHDTAPPPAATTTERTESADAFSRAKGPAAWVARKVTPERLTHERVMTDAGSTVFGVSFGITFSQLEYLKEKKDGVEVLSVINADGSANLESVLWSREMRGNHHIELQGPALNTSLTPGDLPIGARFIGFGVVGEVTNDESTAHAAHEKGTSYTIEVKLTEQTALELAASVGKNSVDDALKALAGPAATHVTLAVAHAVANAVPFVSGALALRSARKAAHVLHDPAATAGSKRFAVAHAVADAVRVVLPIAGSVANAGIVVVAAVDAWRFAHGHGHLLGPAPNASHDPASAPAPATSSEP